jgi:hypothetical protein
MPTAAMSIGPPESIAMSSWPPCEARSPRMTGAIISPAPCAVDIRNDQTPSSRSLTRIVVQRKCARGLMNRKIPKAMSTVAAPMRNSFGSVVVLSVRTSSATSAIDASWPIAIGTRERSTARRLRSCMPRDTAKSQPMAGLMPW